MVPQADPGDPGSGFFDGSLGNLSPLIGIVASLVFWGAFGVAVVAPSSLTQFERNAVFLACGMATLAAGIALLLYGADRLLVTVLLAVPFVVAAVSLPVVVTLLLRGQYPELPVSGLPNIVAALERTLLEPIGLRDSFATTFDREGVGYAMSWLLYSMPLGWFLGSALLQLRFLTGEDL